MKAIHSEEYYRKYWNEFLAKIPGDDYRNLEAELEREMNAYVGLPEEAVHVVQKIEAGKIAKSCEDLVRLEMDICRRVDRGEASFGMMTQAQEIRARAEFRKRFEFNCLQLRDFKEKYL